MTEGRIASIISRNKEDGISPDEYLEGNKYDGNAKIVYEVFERYNQELKNNNGMDFSDILVNTYKLLDNQRNSYKSSRKIQIYNGRRISRYK